MQPIFKNAGQAVHFAFTIEAYPASQGSSLDRIVREYELEAGEGKAVKSGINFGGMTPFEMRYECAKIRLEVMRRLDPHEAAAIEARFSTVDHNRSRAVRIMSELTIISLDVVEGVLTKLADHLVRRHYTPECQRGPHMALRAIAQEHGVSKDRAQRMAKQIETAIAAIETKALAVLSVYLARSNVIEGDQS